MNIYHQNSELTPPFAAIQSMRMFAHDVRRPFRMLELLVELLKLEKDPEEAKKFLNQSIPHIENTILAVDGMIADVLEMDSKSILTTEPAYPEVLVQSSLSDMQRLYPNFSAEIIYTFQHKNNVAVDILKIKRVFVNVFENAMHALAQNKNGQIWVKTREVKKNGKNFVQFCIGNNGTSISKENLSKIFEIFYTTKKHGGTGLGLAIAKKIVFLHGGKIWCESNSKNGVEFFFTLPVKV